MCCYTTQQTVINIPDTRSNERREFKLPPLTATLTTPSRLPFSASFANETETPPLPFPLKNIFSSNGDTPPPENSPTYSEDGLSSYFSIVDGGNHHSSSPSPPFKSPRVELNPRFLMHASNTSTIGSGERTKPEVKSEEIDSAADPSETSTSTATSLATSTEDKNRNKMIPRLWTKHVSLR